jgi:putative transposase
MTQAYVFKLYQNRKNKYLHQKIDIAGIVYNHCIALRKYYYKFFKKSLNKYQLQKHLTKLKKQKKNEFWKILGSQAIQDITDRIERGYRLFFLNRKKTIKSSLPSFKKVKKYRSFTLKQAGYKFLENNRVKIGESIFKYSKSRDVDPLTIKRITIKRDRVGDLFLIVNLEEEKETKTSVMTGKIAGIDFGLKTFLTISDKTQIKSPLFYKTNIKAIIKAHKQLSRKKINSKKRQRAKLSLARLYRSLSNLKNNFFFSLAHSLTNSYDYIFLEDLNIKAMHKLWGRKISDLSFHSFVKKLEHIAHKKGKIVHKINRFFPSSKTCSCCDYKIEELKLNIRKWRCPNCHKVHKRDLNAAINILREGASSLSLDIVRLENSSKYCLKLESNVL